MPFTLRIVRAFTVGSYQLPFVRGFTRVPASRRKGADVSSMLGSPALRTSNMRSRCGLRSTAGSGSASSMSAMGAGGCLYVDGCCESNKTGDATQKRAIRSVQFIRYLELRE